MVRRLRGCLRDISKLLELLDKLVCSVVAADLFLSVAYGGVRSFKKRSARLATGQFLYAIT